MPLHSDLTGAELHEPKGIETATDRQVYVADGAASGEWVLLGASDVQLTDTAGHFTAADVEGALAELYEREFFFYDRITDVSTVDHVLVPIAQDMQITSIRFVLGTGITAADATVSVSRGGDSASLGNQVIAFTGSAEGTTFDFTPTANDTIDSTTHKYIKIATDGASTTAASLYFTVSAIRL